jgi:hypothetical protein
MSTITGYDAKTHGWSKAIVQKMGGVEIADAFLRGEYALTKVEKAIKNFLIIVGNVTVDMTLPVDPVNFFTICEGLWVQPTFRALFVDTGSKSAGQVTLLKYIIKRKAYDKQVINELSKDHIFEAGEFCQILATMLTKQWGGKEGDLNNNGYENYFYVSSKDTKQVFAVNVLWRSGVRRWSVSVWKLDDYNEWPSGRFVFSRN